VKTVLSFFHCFLTFSLCAFGLDKKEDQKSKVSPVQTFVAQVVIPDGVQFGDSSELYTAITVQGSNLAPAPATAKSSLNLHAGDKVLVSFQSWKEGKKADRRAAVKVIEKLSESAQVEALLLPHDVLFVFER
jgi:hypothetical protein